MESKDSKMVAAPQPEPFSWTGFYIGGNLGGTWSDYRLGNFTPDVDVQAQFEELDANFASRPEGDQNSQFDSVFEKFNEVCRNDGSFFGGGQLGYNHQFGHWVLGLEGDFDWLDTSVHRHGEFDAVQGGQLDGFFPRAETHFETNRFASTDWNASVRLRFGYAVERLLLYVTGGAGFADLDGTADDVASTDFIKQGTQTITDTNHSHHEELVVGPTGGVGVEYALCRAATVGIEYRYTNFGGHTFNWDNHDTPVFSNENGIDLDSHQVTFRVNILLCNLFGKH